MSDNLSDTENEKYFELLSLSNQLSNLVGETVVSGKITSIAAGDVEKGEKLADASRLVGQISLELLEQMQNIQTLDSIEQHEARLKETIYKVVSLLTDLLPRVHEISKEEIGDLIETEMQKTSHAIELAVAKLEVKFFQFFFCFNFYLRYSL